MPKKHSNDENPAGPAFSRPGRLQFIYRGKATAVGKNSSGTGAKQKK